MFKKIKKIFARTETPADDVSFNVNQDPASQEQKEEQTRGFSVLDVYGGLLDSMREANKINYEKRINELFPRTFQPVNTAGKTVAMDDCGVKPASYVNDLPVGMMPFFQHTFIGFQTCALLKQNPFIEKACEIPARDAVAVDYELQYENADKKNGNPEDGGSDGDPTTDKNKEQAILNYLKSKSDNEMKIKTICRDANINKKTYGQALAVPVFKNDSVDLSKPFNPNAVKKGSYLGLNLIEPFWVTYDLGANQVSRPDLSGFYEPEYYIINGNMGRKIHKSWVVKLVNGKCPDILKPVYYFGGIPLTQQIYERVFCAEKVANEAPRLALTKRLLIVDGNVQNLIANPDNAYKIMQGVADMRDNMGFMVKNTGEQVQQIDTALSDFDMLIMTQYQLVAAIANMPTTKFMKTQLKGLANTGDYEQNDYSQNLIEIQKNDFNAILDFHYKLLSLSEYGRDIGLKCEWNPIDTPKETEIADIEQKKAGTLTSLIAAGVIAPEEARTHLRNDPDSGFDNLAEDMPFDEYEDPDAEEDPDPDNNPGGGKPDGKGMDEFVESDHPRDADGKFTSGGGENAEISIESVKSDVKNDLESNKSNNRQIKHNGDIYHVKTSTYGVVISIPNPDEDEPIAEMEIKSNGAVKSINTAENFRRKGYATKLLKMAEKIHPKGDDIIANIEKKPGAKEFWAKNGYTEKTDDYNNSFKKSKK